MKRLFNIFMLLALLLVGTPSLAVHAASNTPALPISKLLNTDGTLNLTTGYSGAVDTDNYSVHLDPAHGPVFSPLMTVNAWSSLGSGLNNIVYAIAINGSNVYMGGQFTDAGGDPNADRIAKWNGSSWSALGSGLPNGQVNALAFNGSVLYVGGSFTNAGGVSGANYIAQWNGSTWSTLGDGVGNAVNAIGVSGLNIYIAGNFVNAGVDVNADYIAKLDGGTWAALGATPLTGPVNSIVVAGASVYAGGDFINVGGNPAINRIALWDGTTWSPLGTGLGQTVVSIALSGGDVYAGGFFNDAGGVSNADKIAKWDGTAWSALGSGLSSWVNNVVISGSNIYAGGNFLNAGGDANADYIARWNGSNWSALGTTPLNNAVSAITISGLDLYAGGTFNDAGGDPNGDKIALFQIDATAPTVASFTVTSPSNSLNIPITAFSASDNIAVTGYKITESDTPPATGDTGWTASMPSTYTVASSGEYTLYPWVKDASGNISTVYGAPASVSVSCPATITVTSSADSGAGTLRQTISDFCADSGTINFDSSLSGGTIRLSSTLTLSKNLIINGSALASKITISGDSDNNGTGDVRVFKVENNANVTLDSLIITKGSESYGGGIITGGSNNLMITNSTVSGNTATVYGGGLYTSGTTVTVTNSTFSGNSATVYGGGIYELTGTLKIMNSTFSGNSANSGGGLMNSSLLTVTNSTFSGNTASNNGGGIFTYNTQATVTNSTFSGNLASSRGGGIFNIYGTLTSRNNTFSGNSVSGLWVDSGTLNYANTLIANSTSSGDCVNFGTLGTNTNNLVENGSCSASLSGDPNLDVLAANGGPTQTLALLSGSPAINAGDDTICAASPVSNLDQRGVTRPIGAHCDIGAYEYVDTVAPTVTAFTVSSPVASLNIPITNFTASDNTTVSAYLITESSSQPSAGAAGWTASAPTTYTVTSSGEYTLYPWAKDALGNVSAVYGSPASVSVDNAAPNVVSIVRASTNPTGAASVNFTVTFSESVIGADTGDFSLIMSGVNGASISGVTGSGTTRTVSVNTGSGDGSIRLDLLNNNSIQDGVGNSLSGSFTSGQSYTIDKTEPMVTAFSVPSNSSSLNIPITTFAASDNMGVTDYLITESSIQPSAGAAGWTTSAPSAYTVVSDGSYTLYPWAKDAAGHVSSVYGSPASVEVNTPLLIVTNTNDSGLGSLRDRIANATSGDTITFDPALSGGTIHLASTLTISKNITIDGSALASKIAISGDSDNDGTGDVQVFAISSGATVTLNSLTITKGSNSTAAGIFNASGATLTITNSTLTNNATTGGPGGGIKNDGTLTVTNSTFSGNSAFGGSGGGIRNTGALTVANSTFSSNTTTNSGGGIYNRDDFTLTVTNSTFSSNGASSQGGGIYFDGGTLNYANTIIANSTSGGDCAGTGLIGININNLNEDGSCSALLSGDPNLDALADNGGPTQTLVLLPDSPAINTGDDASCAATDQRGVTRPQQGHCDIGSYEYIGSVIPSVDSFTAPSLAQGVRIVITTFTASDDTAVTGYLVTESSTPPSLNDAGWTASAPTRYPSPTEGTYTLYPWVKDAAGNVSAVYSSPATVEVTFISPYIMTIQRYYLTPNEITNADTLFFALHFYGSVINVDPSDFIVTGGTTATVTNVNSGANSRLVTISGGDLASFNGTVGLDISPSQDIVSYTTGKHLVASVPNPNQTYTVDNTAPTGVSIVRSSANPTSASSVDFTVTFSESVTGVDISDFSLTTSSSIKHASVVSVSGSGETRTVVVNTGIGDGTILLNLLDDDTIVDAATHSLGGGFTTGESYTIGKSNLRAPILRSPQTKAIITNNLPSFWWTNVQGAQSYEIQVAEDNLFTVNVNSEIVIGSPYTVIVPLNDGTYYWRVRAYDVVNQPGTWSSIRIISIDTSAPPIPVLSSPADNSFARRTAIFKWQSNAGSTYQFQYDNNADFSSPNYTVTVRGNFRRPPAMKIGTYYWRVRAKDSAGNWSDWSAPFTINITGR